ncbi:uncharacterized protein C8Q71DRAFT_698833 [Rhodofomes roseus]|uniref:DDE family transposase n=1 Tax=Rhodofomes roseus TaxID=34475 RepID=A0ABQ8KXF9_9APHY|nr:uncharacterized protein C8Q71DRAFT_698833 [Rhodofomes roseus]KAH9843219.1 hypothetical protein C8Q71DRAFT_698833 [Rhodofomes roseus]
MAASILAARAATRGPWFARQLRSWTRKFIENRSDLPINRYGTWSSSRIRDEDFAQEVQLHLQGVGKYVKAMDIVYYLDRTEVKARLGLKRTVSHATAKRWMQVLGYRWTKAPRGQYVDGHERKDVVQYRQEVFLPRMAALEARMLTWSKEGDEEYGPHLEPKDVVMWKQDESQFYAHDRRKLRWVHQSETATPEQKGEGASLMVSDFISADYGWLRSPDGTDAEEARVLFKAGVGRDGYYTSSHFVKQMEHAISIAQKKWPDKKHVFVVDNAKTHLKRPDGSLSALKMPKKIPKDGAWLVEVQVTDADGRTVYGPDRKPLKKKIKMTKGQFVNADGVLVEQDLYFGDGDPRGPPGAFKGMAYILEERGFHNAHQMRAQCKKKFDDCLPGAVECCCRRTLYNQPDFAYVKSELELLCNRRGVELVVLPKFHPELNFIEQVWGYSKRVYRMYPPSSIEADLERNLLSALESVPLKVMRRYHNRSLRFADAYRKGLNGSQAAWANKKYHGHRLIPDTILRHFDIDTTTNLL